MKTIITLAVGFWLGRQIYIKYDKEEAKKMEEGVKNRLQSFLKDNGLSKTEVKETTEDIIGI
jgi:hypothetical protein